MDLDPISKVFTGKISAEIPETAESARDAGLKPELSLEDVIARAKPAVVRCSLLAILPGGEQLAADIIHIDTERDIALVKVEGDAFPYLSLAAASNVRQGETVIAIGNPGDAMPFAVTKGIVSAVRNVSGIGFAIRASDLLAVLLKYFPDPVPPGKQPADCPHPSAVLASASCGP